MLRHAASVAVVASALLAVPADCRAQPADNVPIAIDDPQLNARYQKIIRDVRCMVCESRSIAESPSAVAQDLKKLIYEMLVEGASEAEIAAFLTERFGDSILYRPALQPNTWVLWAGPFVLLAGGAAVFASIVRTRAMRMPSPVDSRKI